MASLSSTSSSKELPIQSGEFCCTVEVSATDTFQDVRAKILEEFDEDMLPSSVGSASGDGDATDTLFYILVGGIRLSSKQESRKLAWDAIEKNLAVSIHARHHTQQKLKRSKMMSQSPSNPTTTTQKRRRMSHTKPSLPENRKKGRKTDHLMVIVKEQRTCVYCSYLAAVAKLEGSTAEPPSKVTRKCLACNIHCCNSHWNVYHGWD
jgi:hypothetical protein